MGEVAGDAGQFAPCQGKAIWNGGFRDDFRGMDKAVRGFGMACDARGVDAGGNLSGLILRFVATDAGFVGKSVNIPGCRRGSTCPQDK
jgi:hypothetical protein